MPTAPPRAGSTVYMDTYSAKAPPTRPSSFKGVAALLRDRARFDAPPRPGVDACRVVAPGTFEGMLTGGGEADAVRISISSRVATSATWDGDSTSSRDVSMAARFCVEQIITSRAQPDSAWSR